MSAAPAGVGALPTGLLADVDGGVPSGEEEDGHQHGPGDAALPAHAAQMEPGQAGMDGARPVLDEDGPEGDGAEHQEGGVLDGGDGQLEPGGGPDAHGGDDGEPQPEQGGGEQVADDPGRGEADQGEQGRAQRQDVADRGEHEPDQHGPGGQEAHVGIDGAGDPDVRAPAVGFPPVELPEAERDGEHGEHAEQDGRAAGVGRYRHHPGDGHRGRLPGGRGGHPDQDTHGQRHHVGSQFVGRCVSHRRVEGGGSAHRRPTIHGRPCTIVRADSSGTQSSQGWTGLPAVDRSGTIPNVGLGAPRPPPGLRRASCITANFYL